MEKTSRGFDYTEFKDDYGNNCSLQKSSSAMTDRVWFGLNDVNPQIMVTDAIRLGLPTNGEATGWVPFEVPKEVMFSDRMHLSQETLHGLMPALEEFIDTGELEGGYETDFDKAFRLDSFSDGYELSDFESMMEELEESVNMIGETIDRMEKRKEKLVKYLSGVKVAAKNLQILIEREKSKEDE
tara:strand:+ start:602 stop:1153 length:552 start_codon:yes stop_codon:yes gene_type:complete